MPPIVPLLITAFFLGVVTGMAAVAVAWFGTMVATRRR